MEKPFCSRRGELTLMKHFVAERSNFVEETFYIMSHVEEKSFGVK